MDSINRNQPEPNHADLSGAEAIEKLRDLAERAKSCFFCTETWDAQSSGSRPMAVQRIDEAGHLWFLSASDSHKNEELSRNPRVRLYFQASPHSGFLVLEGIAEVSKDPGKIEELWNFFIKTWFTEGKDDPRITVIRVVPAVGYYWDTKHGAAVAGIKTLVGAAIGKTLDDSVEGNLSF